jgi:hypothetical protein
MNEKRVIFLNDLTAQTLKVIKKKNLRAFVRFSSIFGSYIHYTDKESTSRIKRRVKKAL